MKNFFVLALAGLTLFAIDSQAAPIPVSIQCDIVGPVYQGILDFDMNPKNWTISESCKTGDGRGILNLPPFSLSFNGIEYISNPGKVEALYRRNCTGDVSYIDGGIHAQNLTSGYGIDLNFHYEAGKFLLNEQIHSTERFCSIRIN